MRWEQSSEVLELLKGRVSKISYSFALVDGDLAPVGNQLGLIWGVDKLKQDIQLWLMERYGGDRFHLTMGSVLQEFIGGIVNSSTSAEIHAEVFRVLQNYQTLQLRRFKEHPELLAASELLVSIENITAANNYDTVNLTLKLRNGSDQSSTITVAQSV